MSLSLGLSDYFLSLILRLGRLGLQTLDHREVYLITEHDVDMTYHWGLPWSLGEGSVCQPSSL